MNKMKNLLYLALALMVVPFMTSCETDDDSNPTIQHPDTFVLNVPAYASTGIYDLAHSESVNVTTTQPDYGYPAITIYEVQVSLDPSFETFETLETTYTTASIDIDGVTLNNIVVSLYQSANDGADPSGQLIPVYIRLQAHVSGTSDTYCLSNSIELSQVSVSYVATIPSTVYVGGASIRRGESGKAFAPVYGLDGQYYAMAYLTAGAPIYWGDNANSQNTAFGDFYDETEDAGAFVGEDGGVEVSTDGWYVLFMKLSIEDNSFVSELTLYPAESYLIGEVTADDAWTTEDPDWALIPGATASEEWTSPTFVGAGELRAYIKVQGIDWWRTEYTIYGGNIYWRVIDIPNNWWTNAGEAYSVQCVVGGHLHVNYDFDTAYVTED